MPRCPLPRLVALLLVLGALAPLPALAHPHVWITSRAEIVFDAQGRIAGVRHAWTFDPAYSAFATQGLDADGDGTTSPEELAALAKENTGNLAEFGYFTRLKVGGAVQALADPTEPRMVLSDGRATLGFTLPLKEPVAPKRGAASLEVYDPTFFVAFALAEGEDAARLKGAPAGCAVTLTRPKAPPASDQPMSEAFFSALTAASSFGAQFANRILVACP